MRILTLALVALVHAAPARAQVDDSKFLHTAAEALDDYATRCFKSKFHQQAKEIWREVISFYDTDHEHARASLGYLRVGSSWAPDSRFEYPDRDELEPAVARVLAKQFQTIAKDLGAGHRELGVALSAAGEAERAKWHFDRAIRFVPDDSTAAAATDRKSSNGIFGSELELTLLRRSRTIDETVSRQLETDYRVTPIKAERQALLEKAKLDHVGVESEHFRVWGDWDEEVLTECAKFAERAFALSEVLYADIKEFRWPYRGKLQFVLLKTRDTWTAVLQANADRFESDHLAFVLANTSAVSIDGGDAPVMIGGFEQQATVEDYAVRMVATRWAQFRCDALGEGLGHAVVGWFFGRNLIFNVAQERNDGGTSTGKDEQRFKLPDLSVWEELAADIAWRGTDTPAAKLPGILASDFSNEQRIKAWSFCDYVLRRDPRLLRLLDNTRTVGGRVGEGQVVERFAESSGGMPITALDDEWRRYWTEDSAILRVIRNKEPILEAVSKRAPEFLEAFNRARKTYGQPEVGWSADYSAECRQHGQYLEQNKGERGPDKEHRQDPSRKGGGPGGRNFARQALVETAAADARKTIEEWLLHPGYRDAILNPGLAVIGLWAEGKLMVMDVTRGQAADARTSVFFPSGVPPGSSMPSSPSAGLVVPNEVPLAALGEEMKALVGQHLKRPPRTIGFPITMHCFRSAALPQPDSIRCVVRLNDKDEVEGFVHVADGGESRRTSAPGMLVFYPLQPLKRGAAYTVEWSWTKGGATAPKKYQFFTK